MWVVLWQEIIIGFFILALLAMIYTAFAEKGKRDLAEHCLVLKKGEEWWDTTVKTLGVFAGAGIAYVAFEVLIKKKDPDELMGESSGSKIARLLLRLTAIGITVYTFQYLFVLIEIWFRAPMDCVDGDSNLSQVQWLTFLLFVLLSLLFLCLVMEKQKNAAILDEQVAPDNATKAVQQNVEWNNSLRRIGFWPSYIKKHGWKMLWFATNLTFIAVIYLAQRVTDHDLNRHMCTFQENKGGLQPLLPDTPADLRQVVTDWKGSPRVTDAKGEDRSATVFMQLQCGSVTLPKKNGVQYCWEPFTQCYQANSTNGEKRVFLDAETIQTVLELQKALELRNATVLPGTIVYTCEEGVPWQDWDFKHKINIVPPISKGTAQKLSILFVVCVFTFLMHLLLSFVLPEVNQKFDPFSKHSTLDVDKVENDDDAEMASLDAHFHDGLMATIKLQCYSAKRANISVAHATGLPMAINSQFPSTSAQKNDNQFIKESKTKKFFKAKTVKNLAGKTASVSSKPFQMLYSCTRNTKSGFIFIMAFLLLLTGLNIYGMVVAVDVHNECEYTSLVEVVSALAMGAVSLLYVIVFVFFYLNRTPPKKAKSNEKNTKKKYETMVPNYV